MARDILSEYGPDSPSNQQPRARVGGDMPVKQIRYSTPQGPRNLGDRGPGLHGDNHGNCGTQGGYREDCETSGSPGIGGGMTDMGTNRRG